MRPPRGHSGRAPEPPASLARRRGPPKPWASPRVSEHKLAQLATEREGTWSVMVLKSTRSSPQHQLCNTPNDQDYLSLDFNDSKRILRRGRGHARAQHLLRDACESEWRPPSIRCCWWIVPHRPCWALHLCRYVCIGALPPGVSKLGREKSTWVTKLP